MNAIGRKAALVGVFLSASSPPAPASHAAVAPLTQCWTVVTGTCYECEGQNSKMCQMVSFGPYVTCNDTFYEACDEGSCIKITSKTTGPGCPQ